MPQNPDAPSMPVRAPVPRLDARTVTHLCGLFFLSRLVVLAVAALSHLVVVQGPSPRNVHTWVERFFVWDSSWYVNTAVYGYFYRPDAQSSVAFYPLLPLLLRVAGSLGLNLVFAGYAISHAALLGACLLLWKLAALETRSTRVAECAVLFLLFCPGAVWFGMIYTESLFLLTQIGCLLCARRGRWIAAGLWGMASALTRTPGLLLAGFLFLEGVQQGWERRRLRLADDAPEAGTPPAEAERPAEDAARAPGRWWKPATWPWLARVAAGVAGPVFGHASYLTFLQLRFGDWRAQQKTMVAGWNGGHGFVAPWTALASQWQNIDRYLVALSMPLLVVMLGLALISLFSLKRVAYAALIVTLCVLYAETVGNATTRYLSTIAPAYLVLAQLADRSLLLERATLVFSVAMMALMTILLANGYLLI